MLRFINKRSLKWTKSTRTFSSKTLTVDNPYSGETYCEVPIASEKQAHTLVQNAYYAQMEFQSTSLEQRQDICRRFMEYIEKNREKIATDITGQMGKPLKQALGEINGTLDRAKALIELSTEALSTDILPEKEGNFRQIVKEPVGVVLVLAPFNYPLMTTVNAVLPAILAGNSVIIKHSPRTPLCGHHYVDAFSAAGVPSGLVSSLHCSNETASHVINRDEIGFVSFTGSVRGGREINRLASKRFINTTLELGGKDAAYVAADASVEEAAAALVDGACYNAGQSCCGIERVYVHEANYDEFLANAKHNMENYQLGNPMEEGTTLGPLAQPTALGFLQDQVEESVMKGARALTTSGPVHDVDGMGRFFAPTLLADCTHSMSVMTEESFGPVMAVARVSSDKEALNMMNESTFGLTGAIYTSDKSLAMNMAKKLRVGTVFMNRCDSLDPYLPWTGVRDSGKGWSLSKYGFSSFTQLKSVSSCV